MLLNSYEFIFVFLPAVWSGYQLLIRYRPQLAIWWLSLASLIFYGYWNVAWLPILVGSTLVNYAIASALSSMADGGRRRTHLLVAGLAFNLLLLGYFKYTNFLVDNLNAATGWALFVERIVLPIGISFITFQKIALLIDSYRGLAGRFDFSRFVLFVTFFPQLIAGPIVHYKEMMPQFAHLGREKLASKLAVGLTIFSIGLFKKVVIADGAAPFADELFEGAAAGASPALLESWIGAVAYGFQIYFDFSAYSDMAIGLAWIFGIRLPVNFASPYKATSIADFWRRWHITLSRFLRDYLYIPLGGNRRGRGRTYVNILATMLLGGIWHGAGWTFLLWGAMHGCFLVVHRLWREWRGAPANPRHAWPARLLTFLCVTLAWVPFRAPDLGSMLEVYRGMFGFNGVTLPDALSPIAALAPGLFAALGAEIGPLAFSDGRPNALLLVSLFVVIWALPNTHQWIGRASPGLPTEGYPATERTKPRYRMAWHPSLAHGLPVAMLLFVGILRINDESPFLYFQF
ncbi:MAG: MBOAT family protein [Dongiaceae bacterium]